VSCHSESERGAVIRPVYQRGPAQVSASGTGTGSG
jgi:hypothetical protein